MKLMQVLDHIKVDQIKLYHEDYLFLFCSLTQNSWTWNNNFYIYNDNFNYNLRDYVSWMKSNWGKLVCSQEVTTLLAIYLQLVCVAFWNKFIFIYYTIGNGEYKQYINLYCPSIGTYV